MVYANVRPTPTAKVLGDILQDASLRFNIPISNLSVLKLNGEKFNDLALPIENCPSRFLLRVQQQNGESTTYETDLEINEKALPIPRLEFIQPVSSSSSSGSVPREEIPTTMNSEGGSPILGIETVQPTTISEE